MADNCRIADIIVGPGHPLAVIAGPCVLESQETNTQIGHFLRHECAARGLPFIFKASFDKANRSSIHSDRGPGLQGLDELSRLRDELGVPVTTDIHEPAQAAQAAAARIDLLQVPAFLCRQTNLLVACAATGLPVNVKKGQFLSPAEMRHVVEKLSESGCGQIMLTERGTFFGYHRLVNDFIGIGDMMELGPPVCFDITHSTQLPGGGASTTAGRPERASLLARAAVAAGVHAVFLECHPEPAKARSDAGTMQDFAAARRILDEVVAIHSVVAQLVQAAAHTP